MDLQKQLLSTLLTTTFLITGNSLLAQSSNPEASTVPFSNIPLYSDTPAVAIPLEPVVLELDASDYKKITSKIDIGRKENQQIHLKKYQKLIVTIIDPLNYWLYGSGAIQQRKIFPEIWYGADTLLGTLECLTWTAPCCLKSEELANHDQTSLSYEFVATNKAGIAYLYFKHFELNTGENMHDHRRYVGHYLIWKIEIIVDGN